MNMLPIRHSLLTLSALLLVSGAAQANDFPTAERVLYVQECMRTHPGSQFEMTNKCACALDTLAADISYDEYVTMSTVSKATTIAGERGGVIRDAPSLAPLAKRYRELQAKANKACFISSSTK
jgi:hypothetical protein